MKYPRYVSLALFLIALIAFSPVLASAKDEWLQVRSKNFFLVGNASEKDIRRVATKMEQFRETFRQLFQAMNVNAPIPTNIIVFKSDSAFKPYKPRRADGKADNFIAGYFQSGEDVNYIAISTEGPDSDTFGTIFHEYVHFIINTNFGKSEVPPWFNEGLAEYYQTFEIEEDQKVKLGYPQAGHLDLLRQNKLMPLETLFGVSSYSLLQTGDHSRSIFYAESWALIHYLVQTGKTDGLGKFLAAILKDVPPQKAFQDAFQITYADMEKELRKYVEQASYRYNTLTFKEKLLFDTQMQTSPLADADSKTYLADLLYHTNRADEAEPLLVAALATNPNSSMANTTLGMVKLKQRKFDEAKAALDKALAQDQKNHTAYYQYAYLLSREGRDEFGYVKEFPAPTAQKMRDLLKKAIALNPEYTESYELLAFVNLVNNENHNESLAYLKKALQYQPGNQRYLLRAAEIYLRQEKFKEAETIISKIASTADEPEIKSRADSLLTELKQRQAINAQNAESRRQYEEAVANIQKNGGRPVFRRTEGEKPMTAEEIEKFEAEANLRSINEALRQPLEGEQRVIGNIQRIECKGRVITYYVQSGSETFTLTSKGFQDLMVTSLIPEANNVGIGCEEQLKQMLAVITYKPANPKASVKGDLIALDFVPNDFRFVDIKTPPPDGAVRQVTEVIETTQEPPTQDLESMRRNAILQSMKEALRKPLEGERRMLGTLEKSECDKKGMYFFMRSGSELLKLFTSTPNNILLKAFVPDLQGIRFGCGMTALDAPVVFTYKQVSDATGKTAGEIISLEFVPKSFVLED
ncbi:MAG TPA: tetratricopeptide repeat protein [Pyrinomonadaceae bacterium]|nr:tetratricopeptide repeat protein [Pyrinomonadaceae bacterium]